MKFEKGRALVITGGIGKSTLARAIAEYNGRFTTITMDEIIHPFELGIALTQGADVLIVEEVDFNNTRHSDHAIYLSESVKLCVERKGKHSVSVDMPILIFVTDTLFETDHKKFKIITISE